MNHRAKEMASSSAVMTLVVRSVNMYEMYVKKTANFVLVSYFNPSV